MTVEKLIQLLEEFDPEAEVRFKNYSIADVDVLDDSDDENPTAVYVIEGKRIH